MVEKYNDLEVEVELEKSNWMRDVSLPYGIGRHVRDAQK